MKELVARARAFHTLSISDLVTIFEDARPAARSQRSEALSLLRETRCGALIGVTGMPGSGKSTLIGKLGVDLVKRGHSVAVVAVDPSSARSGGALLGDRVRVRFPHDEPRLYFRSQANDTELGGLGPHTFQTCRVLERLFDIVIVETVGVGQSETDVRLLADRLYLVLEPQRGDEVQLLKAGVLETPDAVIVNKSDDRALAEQFVATLKMTLPLSRPFDLELPIFSTVATTGEGVEALAADIAAQLMRPRDPPAKREARFFTRWVRQEWGKAGERMLSTKLGGAAAFVEKSSGFDAAQESFGEALKSAL